MILQSVMEELEEPYQSIKARQIESTPQDSHPGQPAQQRVLCPMK